MANIIISLPGNKADLRDEVERTLSSVAKIHVDLPRSGEKLSFKGTPEISLFIEIMTAATAAAGAFSAMTAAGDKLLDLIERIKKQNKSDGVYITGKDGERKPIDEVTDVWLRQQIGDPFAEFKKRWK